MEAASLAEEASLAGAQPVTESLCNAHAIAALTTVTTSADAAAGAEGLADAVAAAGCGSAESILAGAEASEALAAVEAPHPIAAHGAALWAQPANSQNPLQLKLSAL